MYCRASLVFLYRCIIGSPELEGFMDKFITSLSIFYLPIKYTKRIRHKLSKDL